MSDLTRIFCPAFLSLATISHTRSLILCFDFQCLVIFFLMFLIDPNPHLRVYFMFYISLFTLPTSYVVVFGDRIWMRLAFVFQLVRMIFIGFHNVFYPIFVAAYVATGYEGTHPGAGTDEILMHATSYGAVIFFMSLTASLWEPAKLYQIYRLQKMLETSPTVSLVGSDNDEDEDSYQTSETENTSLADSGYVTLMNTV